MDGSCSGLQHYSALLRDEVGGAAVNLVPGERPSDIYTMVAERAQVLSDGSLGGTDDAMARSWQGKFCRKVAKQPTMTLCYSATKFGMKGQIENALHKLDDDGPFLPADVDRYKAAIYASEVIWESLGDVVVAARRAMGWLKKVSDVAVEANIPLRWTSPIGLPVLQDYPENSVKRHRTCLSAASV
jgi:DNA-directed RNA polymerase